MPYTGPSIVDYLKSQGQATDFASRANLAVTKGITNYTGSADQNTQLLNLLRNSSPPPAQPTGQTVKQNAPQNTPAPIAQTQPIGGEPKTAQDLIGMGFYGYQGWPDAEAVANYKATGGSGKGGAVSSGASGGSFAQTPTINLPELYDTYYKESGVKEIENLLSEKTKRYNEAVASIKDNPYLSEARMTGKLRKLEEKFNADTKLDLDQIATRKADIETRLNIQTKQFDINNEQARQALSQFNNLLASGALANASGEDIASITRSTGLSSSMIQSAIKAQKARDVKTSTAQFDDGTNQGFVVFNSDTGEIISKQVVSQSKPKSASVGDQKEADLQQTTQNAISDIQKGVTLKDLVNHYVVAGGLTVEELYRLYNTNSPYGQAKEDIDSVKQGKFVS